LIHVKPWTIERTDLNEPRAGKDPSLPIGVGLSGTVNEAR